MSKDIYKDYQRGQERETERRARQKTNKTRQYDKRNRQTSRPRQKHWQADDFEDDPLPDERIMARDEQERRKVVAARVAQALPTQAESPESESLIPPDLTQGRVLEVSSGLVRLQTEGGEWRCGLRGGLSQHETGFLNVVAVGDWVLAQGDGHGGGVIQQVLPRRNQLARVDSWYRHRMQVIAANVDQLLIVAAWESPPLWSGFIDRCLIAAERFGMTPLICINKVDLAHRQRHIEDYRLPYEGLGHQVLLTSIVTGAGLEVLRTQLAGRVTALTGLSGVGKSSLLTALQPDFQLKTGEVSEGSGEGRHTTTQAVMLPFGDGYVIDTPGVREFGLAGLSPAEVIGFYPDLHPFAQQCRFANCTHFHEPDCAVRAAAEVGQLAQWRYENYQDLFMTV